VHKSVIIFTALDQIEAVPEIVCETITLVDLVDLGHVVLLTQLQVLVHVVYGVLRHLEHQVANFLSHLGRDDIRQHLQVFTQIFRLLLHLSLSCLSLFQFDVNLLKLSFSAAKLRNGVLVVHFFHLVRLELLLVQSLRVLLLPCLVD